MSIEFYLALATFFGSTLIIVFYYRQSGVRLEIRANSVLEKKSQIVSKSYLGLIEKTIERFKTSRTLTEELEDKFEDISYVRARLNNIPDELSQVVDKTTFSFLYGIASVLSTIAFPYAPNINPDPTVSFWVQMGVGVLMLVSILRYVSNGLLQISNLRKFEKLINKIERSRTFDNLFELL